MKFMKLGIRPDTFYTEDATRTVISDATTDLTIQINDICYLLHRHQLIPKSGLLQQLCSSNSENANLELNDIPGGEDVFEVCAKFCYGITINLSALNIVPSLCASTYLHMTEAVHERNLAVKLETFFTSCILQGWKDSIRALNTTSNLPEWSESLGIIRRSIDSIVDKILTAPSKVTWSYTYTRPGYNQRNHHSVPKDWWTEDVSDLDIDLFQCVISTVESTNILPPQLIGESLHVYICRWLPESRSTNTQEIPESSSLSKSTDTKKQIIETIVSLIPADKGSVSIEFLLRLLQLAYAIGVSQVTKAELIRCSSEKLEEATVNDMCYLFEIELIEAVLESYVLQWRRKQKHSEGIGHVSLTSIQKIGKLVDYFLQVVATDINTPVVKIVSLAKTLPDIARPDHDDLYKAIHIYLTEHPDMEKAEKKQLCSVVDFQKLSGQARGHAVRNDLLPLRTVVQILLFEHEEMKGIKASTTAPVPPHVENDERIVSHEGSSNTSMLDPTGKKKYVSNT